MNTVFLVIDSENAPGRIYAVFSHKEDAERFERLLPYICDIEERTVFIGQPPNMGFNL